MCNEEGEGSGAAVCFPGLMEEGRTNVIRITMVIYEFVQTDVAVIGKTLITNSRHLRQES